MIEDEIAGWHPWLNEQEFEPTSGDGEGQRSLAATVHKITERQTNLATERQQQHLEKQLALGAGIQWTGKKSYCPEKEEELGDGRDGRAEESLATGDGGQVQFHSHWTLMDLPYVQIFESSQLEGSYEGDLLYISCSLFSGVNAE